jgi:Mn2+/Fe2+ NRAMP family transporter
MNVIQYIRIMGPGFILAGAAIGVSHLVQATRAGADYGLSLLWLLLLACATKYPFLQIGPRYAAATGKNLIQGYLQLGKWAFYLFIFLTLGTMFIILAAVTLVTAGIAEMVFAMDWSVFTWSGVILAACAIILFIGRYGILDISMKVIITILTVCTLVAVILAWYNFDGSIAHQVNNNYWNTSALVFIIALMGWMPIPLDAAVWHSIWTLEKERDSGNSATVKAAVLDFNAGYIIATVIGILFLLLGALVMFGSTGFSNNSVQFSGQLIDMYTRTLGTWSWPIIAGAALITMFSTTLAVADAYPRVLVKVADAAGWIQVDKHALSNVYNFSLIGICSISLAIIYQLKGAFTPMVDFATSLSFLSAPILAWLNLKVLRQPGYPHSAMPGKPFFAFAYASLLILIVFSGLYIYTKL